MLGRIQDCLCHPKFIGMYYKDKLSKVIGIVVVVFIFFMIISGVYSFSKVGFDYSVAKGISNEVQLAEDKDVSYDSTTFLLKGEQVSYSYSIIGIHFLSSEAPKISSTELIVLDFKESSVGVYISGTKINEYEYSKINGNSFSLLEVKKGNLENVVDFQDFIHSILDNVNIVYQGMFLGSMISQVLTYYISLVIIVYIFSRFYNPNIDKKTRLKLCIYSTIVYIFSEIFVILFNAQWISYLGVALAVIYPRITFSHIRRR